MERVREYFQEALQESPDRISPKLVSAKKNGVMYYTVLYKKWVLRKGIGIYIDQKEFEELPRMMNIVDGSGSLAPFANEYDERSRMDMIAYLKSAKAKYQKMLRDLKELEDKEPAKIQYNFAKFAK